MAINKNKSGLNLEDTYNNIMNRMNNTRNSPVEGKQITDAEDTSVFSYSEPQTSTTTVKPKPPTPPTQTITQAEPSEPVTPTTSTAVTPTVSTASTSMTTTSTTPTNVNEIPFFSASKLGNLEYKKHLYETGLQNIFNDYQTNIQNLQQQEKDSLQQAYYLKEISKKYLGEYASNVGIGNVSGNLLDIYSQYASNMTNIDKEFTSLELNLTRQYMVERMKTFNNILETEFEITKEAFDQVAIDVTETAFTEYDRDVVGGLAYIDSQKSLMDPVQFEQIRESYYKANYMSVIETLNQENPFFGFANLETKTLKTREQFLEEAKAWISEKDWVRIEEQIAFAEILAANEGAIDFVPVIVTDPSTLTKDPLVTKDSDVFDLPLPGGVISRYAVASEDIFNDLLAQEKKITEKDLREAWAEQSGKSINEIGQDDIVKFVESYYIQRDGRWFRMISVDSPTVVNIETMSQSQLRTWNPTSTGLPAFGVEINFNYGPNKFDAITYNGKTYVEDGEVGEYSKLLNSEDIPMKEIILYLNKTFATQLTPEEISRGIKPTTVFSDTKVENAPKGQIFYFQGKFYVYTADGKKIRPMNLES